jgi:Ca2+-binding RTX toxin-like protein
MPANTTGTLSSLFGWPVIGIHSILTQDGKVLSFGTDKNGLQGATMFHDVWDPVTNTHTTVDHHTSTATDIFCSNAVIIPGSDNILIGGGDTRPFGTINNGVADVNLFNTTTNQITPDSHGKMAYARWYATAISLSNGQILQLGGRSGTGTTITTPEIYTPGEGWRSLTGATDPNASQNYDRAFVRNDGKVVYFNASGNVMLLDTTGNGTITKIGTLPFGHNWESPAIQFSPGKILVNDAGSGLWVMDINNNTPTYSKVGDLGAERNFASMTVLADGRVMINGGSTITHSDATAIKTVLIWDPSNNSLTNVASEAVPRLYHSTSILLPDGSVLSMGGGSFGSPSTTVANQQNGQIYKPAYLYDATGTLATRPKIVDAPEHVQAGTTFSLQVDNAADISKITLVKSGAVTHDFNMNSGFASVTYTVGPNNTIIVSLPDQSAGITSGSWMVFVWNKAGVPAVAPVIEIDPVFNTGAAVDPANLLTNGSFETAAAIGSGVKVLDDIAGWQSSKNNFETWGNGAGNVTGTDGKTFIEIDAERGTISQDLKTKAGQTYDVSFDFAGRPGFVASSKMEVVWNGVVIATITPAHSTFKTYTVKVTGTGGQDVLAFRNLAADTDTVGGFLDHVTLKAGVAIPSNLIVNGTMEAIAIPGGQWWQTYSNTQVPGWKNAGQDNVVVVNHLGSQVLDLDPEGANDELYQLVQTKSGQAYTLSFSATATVAGSSTIEVLWNGVKIATVDPSTTAFEKFTFTVTGTGGLDKLSFRELAGQNDYLGSYLDNVSLVEGTVTPPTVNLIANGTMEAQKFPTTGYWQAYTNTQVTGWQNSGADYVVLVNHLGSQMLDLDPEGANDELFQLVKTSAGQRYTLGFDATATAPGSSKIDVLWNGVVIATIDPSTTALQHFTFQVTGTGGQDKLSFRELTSENDYLGSYLDNVTLVATSTTPKLTDATHHEGNHIEGTNAANTMNGTVGADHFKAMGGNDVVDGAAGDDYIDGGKGNDSLTGSHGADYIDGGLGNDTIAFASATSGVTVDLTLGQGSRGEATGDTYANVENVVGSNFDDIIVLSNSKGTADGQAGDDKLQGGTSNNTVKGGSGEDMIAGKQGADRLSGGSDSDTFFFATGDSGQSKGKLDVITDFEMGPVNTGDSIDFVADLRIGGSNAQATSSQASIDATTGVASFAVRSGATLADCLHDIAMSMTTAGDAMGELALFEVAGKGDTYLFISDGVAGVTVDDVVVRLSGITTVGAIDLTGGDLTILS